MSIREQLERKLKELRSDNTEYQSKRYKIKKDSSGEPDMNPESYPVPENAWTCISMDKNGDYILEVISDAR